MPLARSQLYASGFSPGLQRQQPARPEQVAAPQAASPGDTGFVLRQVRPDPAPLLQPAAGCKRGTGQGSPLPEERWLLLSTQWGFSNRKLTISCFLHHLAPHQLAFSRVTRPLALASDSTLAERATGSLRFSSHPYVCTNQLFTFYKKSTLLEASALAITIYYFG